MTVRLRTQFAAVHEHVGRMSEAQSALLRAQMAGYAFANLP